MRLSDIKFGNKFYGKFSGSNFVVVSTSENFMGRGETVFMVCEENPSTIMSFAFDTFTDYYERLVEVRTICQRMKAGYDSNGNVRAIWIEYDAGTGDVMSVTKETNSTPKRLYGVPQLPDIGISNKERINWIKYAKNSESILFYES